MGNDGPGSKRDVRVPVELRAMEPRQLRDFVPTAMDVTEEDSEEAAALDRVNEQLEEDEDFLSLTFEDWTVLIQSLSRKSVQKQHGKSYVWWLRTKLSKRLRERMNEI